jgi:hypothetical protein
LASLFKGVNGKPGHVVKKVNIATPGASSEGEVAQSEHERIVEAEPQLELTQDARPLNQAQSALQKAKADADERSQRAFKQIMQHELAKVRPELQVSPFTTVCASAPVRAGPQNRSPESSIPSSI